MTDKENLLASVNFVFHVFFGQEINQQDMTMVLSRFLPSPYTLLFPEVQVDCAYMLCWAFYLQAKTLWNLSKLDSSPQAGVELLANDIDVIDEEMVIIVAEAIGELGDSTLERGVPSASESGSPRREACRAWPLFARQGMAAHTAAAGAGSKARRA